MNYSIILPTLNENGHIIDLINSIIKNFTNTKNNYDLEIMNGDIGEIIRNDKETIVKINNYFLYLLFYH